MKKLSNFQINVHGVDNSQYIQVSPFGTSFSYCALGAGMNEKEAFNDAVNLIASEFDTSIIPNNPKGINAKNKVPAKMQGEDSDMYYYVSIFYNVSETILIRVTNEGYLLGATNDLINGKGERYWSDYYEEGMSEFEPETHEITVPIDISANLIKQGTSEQVYSDGYEAMNEVNKILSVPC